MSGASRLGRESHARTRSKLRSCGMGLIGMRGSRSIDAAWRLLLP